MAETGLTAEGLDAYRREVDRLRAELAEARDDVEIGDEKISELNGITVKLEKRAAHWERKANAAEAERDLLRETLAESDLGAQVLAQWEAIAAADADRDRLQAERDRYRTAWQSARARAKRYGDICCCYGRELNETLTRAGRAEVSVEFLEARHAQAKTERDALKAAVAEVRVDAERHLQETGTTADRWKLGVYAQAARTMRILNHALAAPETTPDAPTGGED